jgi:hypothetical protein
VQNFTYTFDRYGNRWAQNAPQGGPALSISFSKSNNIINSSGFSNDVPGNIANDSIHGYSYDADGNLIAVDNGATAKYYYDSLNQRALEGIFGDRHFRGQTGRNLTHYCDRYKYQTALPQANQTGSAQTTTIAQYDSVGRMANITYRDATAARIWINSTRTYNQSSNKPTYNPFIGPNESEYGDRIPIHHVFFTLDSKSW